MCPDRGRARSVRGGRTFAPKAQAARAVVLRPRGGRRWSTVGRLNVVQVAAGWLTLPYKPTRPGFGPPPTPPPCYASVAASRRLQIVIRQSRQPACRGGFGTRDRPCSLTPTLGARRHVREICAGIKNRSARASFRTWFGPVVRQNHPPGRAARVVIYTADVELIQ